MISFANLVSLHPHPEQEIRRSARVVAMLAELHKVGFQRLRAMPFMSPSGMHWRLWIGPTTLFHHNHGAMMATPGQRTLEGDPALLRLFEGAARYTSGQATEGAYFGWDDAAHDDARQLAAKFLDRFPDLARAGQGWDYEYAGWFSRLFGLVEQGLFPVAMADGQSPTPSNIDLASMRPRIWGEFTGDAVLPLPPPGEYPEAYDFGEWSS